LKIILDHTQPSGLLVSISTQVQVAKKEGVQK